MIRRCATRFGNLWTSTELRQWCSVVAQRTRRQFDIRTRRCGMGTLRELDVVRVVKLLTINRPYQGTIGASRPPCVGDTGTVVARYNGSAYCIESVDSDGKTVWLADFLAVEPELILTFPDQFAHETDLP